MLKKYRKKPFSELDRLYVVTLIFSFLLHYGVVGYFVMHPPASKLPIKGSVEQLQAGYADDLLGKESAITANFLQIDKADYDYSPSHAERTASLRLERTAEQEPVPFPDSDITTEPEVADRAASQGDNSKPGEKSRRSVTAPGEQGSGSSNGLRQEEAVSDQGILGALTKSGKTGGDKALNDVLGSDEDLDKIYEEIGKGKSSVKGTQSGSGGQSTGTGTASGRKQVQGRRRTATTSIETHISDIEGGAGGTGSSGSGGKTSRNTKMIKTELTPIRSDNDQKDEERRVLVGARDLNTVSEVVFSHNSAIQYCFERELQSNPDLRGKIVIRFTITPAGTVINPEIISSTLNSKHVERCILSRVSLWNDFGAIDAELGNAVFRQVYTFGY